jgi:hypothetical protein
LDSCHLGYLGIKTDLRIRGPGGGGYTASSIREVKTNPSDLNILINGESTISWCSLRFGDLIDDKGDPDGRDIYTGLADQAFQTHHTG